MKKQYFYLTDEKLKKGYPCVIETSEEHIENYEIKFLEREQFVREYVGEILPERLMWDSKKKIVRECTETEKYILSPETYQLQSEKYYIKDEKVKELPSGREVMLKPVFNVETEQWEETATSVEIENYANAKYKEFYYQELELFKKATAEFQAGILTEKEYKECQEYIRFLNSQLNVNPKLEGKRPSVMNY